MKYLIGFLILFSFGSDRKLKESVVHLNLNKIEDSLHVYKADSIFNDALQLYRKERKYREAKQKFKLADSLYQKLNKYERVLLAKKNLSLCNFSLYQPYTDQMAPLNEGLKFVSYCDPNAVELALFYMEISVVNTRDLEHENAKYYSTKAFHIYEMEENKNNVNIIKYRMENLHHLAFVETRLSNFEIAETYLNEAIKIAKAFDQNLTMALNFQLHIYLLTDQNDKAEALLTEAHDNEYYKNTNLFIQYDFFKYKMEYYLKSKNFDLAIDTSNELREIIDNSPYKKHFIGLYFETRIARIYYEMGAFEKVTEVLEKSINSPEHNSLLPGDRGQDLYILARSYFELNQLKKCETYLIKAFENHNIHANDDFYAPIEAENLVNKDLMILDKLKLKAELCRAWFNKTANEKYDTAMVQCYEALIETIKIVGRRSNEDKFITEELFKSVYGNLLDAYHDEWKGNNLNSDIFYKALRLSDESKIITVLNEISKVQKAKLFSSVPKDLILKEQSQQSVLDSINRLIASSHAAAFLEKAKDSIVKSILNFQDRLKLEYPNYYRLNYFDTSNLEAIIEKKYKDYNIIQFFWGDKYIYIFNKNNENLLFEKFLIDENFENEINTFIIALRQNSSDNFKTLGANIYDKLFKKIVDPSKKTIVILDDKLQLFPIEALWAGDVKDGQFLIEITSVLRLNSLSQEVILPNRKKRNILLFAPYASQSDAINQKLSASLKEVTTISDLFKSDVFLNEKASKEEFIKQVSKYPIIHLATHSTIDETTPLKSKIYFNNVQNLEPHKSVLSLKELYGLNLDADLITLSGCETGIGKEIKGKGILSFSTAFTFAGVSSSVMSLWKVPDKETSEVMSVFYENLHEGLAKDDALQQAKLTYLNNTPDNALHHPYYWSGFVISGDPSPISTANFSGIWYLLLLAVLVGVIFFIRKNRKAK